MEGVNCHRYTCCTNLVCVYHGFDGLFSECKKPVRERERWRQTDRQAHRHTDRHTRREGKTRGKREDSDRVRDKQTHIY